MPCRSEYMEANDSEKELSKVLGLLDELETKKLPENFGTGYDSRVYNKYFTKKYIDRRTAELCSKLQKIDVTQYSLEMQMWWRNHQELDKKRVEEKIQKAKEEKDKEALIAKLTPYEKKLLKL